MSQQAQAVLQTQQKTTEPTPAKGSILQRAAINTHFTPVHHGILQRCSGGVECEECRQKRLEREGMLQRAAVSAEAVNSVPPIVHEVLRSPGQPLDAGTQAFMEPKFGYDFSQVRVHTDARAAESARAVNALAYTVGRDVVFGEGEYEPGTRKGRKLLAHELTHVVQQGGPGNSGSVQHKLESSVPGDPNEHEAESNAQMVEDDKPLASTTLPLGLARAQGETTVEVTAPTGPNVCGLEQHKKIFPAAIQSQTWLNQTTSKLGSYNAAPDAKSNEATGNALKRHFQTKDVDRARYILRQLNQIKTDISSRTEFNVECHDDRDRTCGAAGAYVINDKNLLVFCPSFFNGSDLWRAETIIHEMAHALVGGDHITDRGYARDRVYPLLSTDEALTNAESYGLFVQELGTNRISDILSPKDPHKEDCPDDWKSLITVAIARAQRWNRDAQVQTRDRRQSALDEWILPRMVYLGANTSAVIDAAQKAYDEVEENLRGSVDFECEPEGGGRCDKGAHVYWYGIFSDFHICPAWKELNKDDQIIFMLAGLYGYLAGVDDETRRLNYARLAKSLTKAKPRPDIGKEPEFPVFE